MPVILYVAYICTQTHTCSTDMTNMHNLVGKFVSRTYVAVVYEVDGAVGCDLVYICSYVTSICSFTIEAV